MEPSPKKYPSAGTPPVVKEYRAELALALKKRGVPLYTFLLANNETRFPTKQSTLYRHVQRVDAGEAPLSAEKKSGRPGALTGEQWDIVCGAILSAEEKCSISWVKAFVLNSFGVDVSEATVSRHLKDCRMTLQMVGLRPMPKNMTRENYVAIYYEFLLSLHNNGFFQGDPKSIYCIDSTTNSYRLERERTYNIRGGKQKKFSGAKPTYINTYLAAFALQHDGQFPSFMFSFDPTFNPDGEQWKAVLEWCHEWGIDPSRIVYEPSQKQYCAESAAQVGHFATVYRTKLRHSRVLHDAGNAFKRDGQYILADGASMHFVFPPAPHGEMSILDNNLFAIAKKWWRSEREKACGQNFSKQALFLLKCIDRISSDQVQAAWTKNFLLDKEKPSLQVLDERLRASNRLIFSNQQREFEYMEAYNTWLKDHEPEEPPEVFEALNSTLDGAYWK